MSQVALTSACNEQIVTMWRTLHLTPEQISEDTGYNLMAVKMCLMANCPDYALKAREEGENEDKPLFSKEEVQLAKDTIVALAGQSEIDNVRLKASIWIVDEAKGRNDIKALVSKEGQFNITLIQQTMNRAREAMEVAKKKAREKIVDIDTTCKKVAA